MIDWAKFFDKHHVEYVEGGDSTAKGNIYVRCPFCGDADQGHHMGISLKGKGWGCWRDQRHRGRDPRRLVGAVLGVPLAKAGELLKLDGEAPGFVSMPISERVKAMKAGDEIKDTFKLKFPSEIKPLNNEGQGRLFIAYLKSRGFDDEEAAEAAFRYKLRYAMRGVFSYRLVIPVYDEYELVTWTGRSIVEDEEIRYKTLSKDPTKGALEGMPKALGSITDFLWNEGTILKGTGRGLVICEGPIDAIKVDYFCRQSLGVYGTCIFGKGISNQQVSVLHEIAPYYKHKYLLLDRDAGREKHKLITRLYHWGYRLLDLPKGNFKDPGGMPKDKLVDFIELKCA